MNSPLIYDQKLERLKCALATGLRQAANGEFADYSLEKLFAELDMDPRLRGDGKI